MDPDPFDSEAYWPGPDRVDNLDRPRSRRDTWIGNVMALVYAACLLVVAGVVLYRLPEAKRLGAGLIVLGAVALAGAVGTSFWLRRRVRERKWG